MLKIPAKNEYLMFKKIFDHVCFFYLILKNVYFFYLILEDVLFFFYLMLNETFVLNSIKYLIVYFF